MTGFYRYVIQLLLTMLSSMNSIKSQLIRLIHNSLTHAKLLYEIKNDIKTITEGGRETNDLLQLLVNSNNLDWPLDTSMYTIFDKLGMSDSFVIGNNIIGSLQIVLKDLDADSSNQINQLTYKYSELLHELRGAFYKANNTTSSSHKLMRNYLNSQQQLLWNYYSMRLLQIVSKSKIKGQSHSS